ncbi:unnamed protein product [Tilletia controversa]|nr:unnamed protein product [Tilletia controversa]
MTKYFSPSLVAVAAFASLAAGSPVPVSLPASADLSPANSPAVDTGASRFMSPDAMMSDGNPDRMNQPSFNYEANFARRGGLGGGLGLLGLGGDVNQNVNELGGGVGGGGLPTGGLPVGGGGGLSPDSLPPILTGTLDTAGANPNTAEIKLNLCRLLGVNCPKTPLTSTNLPKVKGEAKAGTKSPTKGKGKPKPKPKGKGASTGSSTSGKKGSTGSKFSGGKNQINDKHNSNGGNGTGGHGGSANGGSASCDTTGSLVGLNALNFNSCNGGNGGSANGGPGTGGRGGDTSNNLGRRVLGHDAPASAPAAPAAPAAAKAPATPAGAPSAPAAPAGAPSAPAPASNAVPAQGSAPDHRMVAASLNRERDAQLDAGDSAIQAVAQRGTHVDAADSTVQAVAERGTQVLAQKKQGESMASFVSRTLTNFRAQQKAPAAPAKAAAPTQAPAQAPAQAPSSPQVPAEAPKAPQAAPKPATPASAASTKFQHARDVTVAQITNGTPSQAAAAQQIPAEARLVNLEGSEANINAGPHAESRDVMVAQIKNDGVQAAPVSRDLTLAQISDQADEVDEDAEDAPSQAQAQAAPASVPATAQPAGVAQGAATKSDTLSSARPNARAFSVTAVQASENETDDDDDESSASSPEAQARAAVTLLHNTDGNKGDVSSKKRALTVSGDQNGNAVSTDFDGQKGAKYNASGSTPSSSSSDDGSAPADEGNTDDGNADDGTTDDSSVQDGSATDDGSNDDTTDPTAPNKRGNNKAGVATGKNREGRVIIATAGNGGDAVSGNGGDASGFAFDNSRNGYTSSSSPSSRPLRFVKPKFVKGGYKSKTGNKSSGSHHFKVKGGRKTGSSGSNKAKSTGKLSATGSGSSTNNPIIEIDLALLRQLIGQDRLSQLATSEKGANDELVAAPSKKYSVSRPQQGSGSGSGSGSASGSAHIAGSGNGGDASSGPAIAGNGGNVVISQ